jgi:hypothetical protein
VGIDCSRAREKARKQTPALSLFADDVHPSLLGTYLAACVFYAALFGESPVGAAHPPGLDEASATLLQSSPARLDRSARPSFHVWHLRHGLGSHRRVLTRSWHPT